MSAVKRSAKRSTNGRQSDLFLPSCPDCSGYGQVLFAINVVRSRKLKMCLVAKDVPLRKGEFPLAAPSKPNALWDQFKVVLVPMARTGQGPSKEYVTCPRCRGAGRLEPEQEARWQKFQAWRRGEWSVTGVRSDAV